MKALFAKRPFALNSFLCDRILANFQVVALTAGLLAALKLLHVVQPRSSVVWMGSLCALAVLLSRARYIAAEMPIARLLQLVGILSTFYSLFHYPLMPPLETFRATTAYAVILLGWVGSVVFGIACFRFPSLALVPAAYLYWSASTAHNVTGLPHHWTLDIAPIPEVAACAGIGLAILQIYRWRVPRTNVAVRDQFAVVVLTMAICIHLANYYWSAVAKLTLNGPLLSWVTFNNPLYIYLAAIDLDHITFSDLPVAGWLGDAIDRTHLITNVVVLGSQAAAIVGFLITRRLLVALLIVYDTMHVAIALAAGANFWPWILLNLAIAAVVLSPRYQQPSWMVGLAAAAFILVSPSFANVARLGWYDLGAQNKRYFQAEDRDGRRYFISTNFFTFYSYPIAHMAYGLADPQSAFATGLNGGVGDYDLAIAGRTCDTKKLISSKHSWKAPPPELSVFITNYHRMAQTIENLVGLFPYNIYAHHFYVRPGLMEPFERVDKRTIVAYIFRRESVCLSWVNHKLHRRVITTAEHRIEIH